MVDKKKKKVDYTPNTTIQSLREGAMKPMVIPKTAKYKAHSDLMPVKFSRENSFVVDWQ